MQSGVRRTVLCLFKWHSSHTWCLLLLLLHCLLYLRCYLIIALQSPSILCGVICTWSLHAPEWLDYYPICTFHFTPHWPHKYVFTKSDLQFLFFHYMKLNRSLHKLPCLKWILQTVSNTFIPALFMIIYIPLVQTVKHGARNATIIRLIPRECMNRTNVWLWSSQVYTEIFHLNSKYW